VSGCGLARSRSSRRCDSSPGNTLATAPVSSLAGAASKRGGSSRQGCWSNEVQVFIRQLSGFGRIAYPMHGKVTTHVLLGCKSHCCSVLARGGSDQSGSKCAGLNRSKWLQPRKFTAAQKSLCRDRGNADSVTFGGRPMFCWEVTDKCTSGIHRGRDPDTHRRTSGDNVGKGHCPAGADSNLLRPVEPDCIKVGRRVVVWRMSPDERGRAGNAAPGSQEVTHAAEARGGKGALGTWWATNGGHQRDSVPYEGDDPSSCRARGIIRGPVEARESALYSPFCEEGPLGTGPLGLSTMVANRTREIRPSGITTGAWGIVRKGSRIEAQREIAGSATVPCRRMRLRSIQTLMRRQ
jgi:hypothetical protein